MMTKHLTRPFEIRSVDETGRVSGYASVFGVTDSYGDVVEPGAFAKSIAQGKAIPMLWQHRPSEPIGSWHAMEEDAHGLHVEGQILVNAGPTERRAYEHLKAGTIRGLSIGYYLPDGGAVWDAASKTNRLKEIDLVETSVVTFPANREAEVNAVKALSDMQMGQMGRMMDTAERMAAEVDADKRKAMLAEMRALASEMMGGKSAAPTTIRELERALRDAGLSREDAKALMSRGAKALDLRDAEESGLEDVKQLARNLLAATERH